MYGGVRSREWLAPGVPESFLLSVKAPILTSGTAALLSTSGKPAHISLLPGHILAQEEERRFGALLMFFPSRNAYRLQRFLVTIKLSFHQCTPGMAPRRTAKAAN